MVVGQTIGSFCICFAEAQRFSEEKRTFFETLAQQCAQTLERTHLYEETRERAALEERQRLARDLQDSVSQNLFSINMMGQSLPRLLDPSRRRAYCPLSHCPGRLK